MKLSKTLLFVIALSSAALVGCSTEAAKEPGAEAAPAAPATGVAATIGDEVITLEELDSQLGSQLAQIRQQEFDLRSRALEQIILRRLLEAEAEAAGVDLQGLTKIIDGDAPKPSDEDVDKAYAVMKEQDDAVKSKNEEQGKKLVQQRLENQYLQKHRDEYLSNLMAKNDVSIKLDPPRADVTVPPGEPARGPEDAPVTIVEFADYQCGYCKRSLPVIHKLLEEYGDQVRFVFRDYPLQFHPRAEPSAAAARCAGDQGKYWEYHDNLMSVNGTLDDADLLKRAEDLELDIAAFTGCYESKRHNEAVRAGFAEGSALGVTGTPTFFINGRMLVGAQSYGALAAVIEDELKREGAKTQ